MWKRNPFLWFLFFALLLTMTCGQQIIFGSKTTYILRHDQLKLEIQKDNIKSTEVDSNGNITGEFKNPIEGKPRFRSFVTPAMIPNLEHYLDQNKSSSTFTMRPVRPSYFEQVLSVISWVLPLLLIIFLFNLMQRGPNAGGNGPFNFGKSKAKLATEKNLKINFNDVAGVEEAKEELKEMVEFLKNPEKFRKIGARIPKGVLLIGPPGTGKTLLARAVAGEAGVPFLSISGSDFVEMFVGVGASRVRDLFEEAKKKMPCIVFIDEVDAVGRHRGTGISHSSVEHEQTLTQLLSEMDGFEANEGIIVIAATNRPDVLDPAFMRPGRFDRQVMVDRPDLRGREEILKIHTRKVTLEKGVDLKVIARGTPGFAGADLENLINEAALNAARRNRKEITMEDLERAKYKVLEGPERRSIRISDEEKRITAYHEIGHAMVAAFSPKADPVHKITIIPRGMSMGSTMQLPIDDRHNYSEPYIRDLIAVLTGGRAAEEIFLSFRTTGAQNDIERATDLAENMVCKWGMSENLGFLKLGEDKVHPFLGKSISEGWRDYSDSTAQRKDEEMRRIVEQGQRRAEAILKSRKEIVHKAVKALLEKESLTGEEFQELIKS